MEILISTNKKAIIDDEDYPLVSNYVWYLNAGGYAVNVKYVKGSGRKNRKDVITFMHRLINKTAKGYQVDHINGNPLDNRKINLRNCSAKQNSFNHSKHKNTSSIYKNVSWDKQNQKWRASIGRNFIGLFIEQRHAAMASDIWLKERYGKFAKLNFELL